jgi:Ca2+-binding EF-hand superfamily protein
MRIGLLAALMLSVAAPVAAQRGAVSTVAATPANPGAATAITVRGSNPCSAVFVEWGDGTTAAQTVKALPATLHHAYANPGVYQVRVRGTGNCAGTVTTRVEIAGAGREGTGREDDRGLGQARFRGLDRNGDGRITRDEWNGSAQSFRVHDWNGDGVLSGAEVTPGARRTQPEDEDYLPNRLPLDDWSERRFGQLDHNGDNRISRQEWHYDLETFQRVDRNRDGVISRAEFLDTAFDDDRGDLFDNLDVNGNNRVEIAEWHGSRAAFDWIDRNRDGVLSRTEMVSGDAGSDDQFRSLDINGDGSIGLNEWHWSRASFTQLDRNRDNRLSRAELDAAGPLDETGNMTKPLLVDSTDRWTDTGIYLRAGTTVTITATGTITMSNDSDGADPRGSYTGRRAENAPLPDQPAGMLIARIGNEVIPVGASRTFRVAREGRLYFSVNDDHLADNHGAFSVTIRTQVYQ